MAEHDTGGMAISEETLRRILREELLCTRVVVGLKNIKLILGIKSTVTLMRYYNQLGFPMVKGLRGQWQIHQDSIKEWMTTRSLIGRKAREMGLKTRGMKGRNAYPRIERLSEQEMGLVLAAIREDSAR